MTARTSSVLALFCALLSISTTGAATLTNHPDETSFRDALDPEVALTEEDWDGDGFAEDTLIDIQVSGVTFSSPGATVPVQIFYTNRAVSRPGIVAGGLLENGTTSQTIVADFFPAPIALAFTVVAQHPEALNIQMLVEFTDGDIKMIPLPDNDGTNRNREFWGITSDTPISRVTYTTNQQSSGLFSTFGGWDNFIVGFADTFAPICLDEPAIRGGVLGVEVTCTDNQPGDTGIVSAVLSADAINITPIDPFTAPAATIIFFLAQIDDTLDGAATVTTTDGAGNTDLTPINFTVVPGGTVVNKLLCSREGIELSVSNDNATNPTELTTCSGSGLVGEPALPAGYEPFPNTFVYTIDSGISGDTFADIAIAGEFEPRTRGLFANRVGCEPDFCDFVDLTEEVVQGTTRVGTKKGKWSEVKYTFAIHAEICDGIDNDGDGLIDEGFEQQLVDCTTEPVDPTFCDIDGDLFLVCGDPASALRGVGPSFVNVDCADQLGFRYPGATELCNGMDDDCDGTVDDGLETTCGLGECEHTIDSCINAMEQVCDPLEGASDELCNGLDDDCDGTVDEPDATDAPTWYEDADGDGFGDPAVSQRACAAPAGFVADNTDCDDTIATCNSDCTTDVDSDGTTDCADSCLDADGDGFGSAGGAGDSCAGPDCDDTIVTCNSDCTTNVDGDGTMDCADTCLDADGDNYGNAGGAGDTCTAADCNDAIATCTADCTTDADDDGTMDCADTCLDADGDNYGDAGGAGNSCTGTDCNDAIATCTADCTTDVDADGPDCADTCLDVDGDGFGSAGGAGNTCTDADCDDTIATCTADCTTDVDLDGTPDCADTCLDADGDNFGNAGGAGNSCDGPDCDDGAASINPGAIDACDGVDNDCNGIVDNYECVRLDGYLIEIVKGPNGEFPVSDANGDSVFAYRISGQGTLGESCGGVQRVSHADILVPVCDPAASGLIDIIDTDPRKTTLHQDGQGDPSTGFGAGDFDNDVLKWSVAVRCQQVKLDGTTERIDFRALGRAGTVIHPETVVDAVFIGVEETPTLVDFDAVQRVGTLIESVEHAVAVAVQRTTGSVDERSFRGCFAGIDAVGHTVAVGIQRTTVRSDVPARGRILAGVETVQDEVPVGIHRTPVCVDSGTVGRVPAAVTVSGNTVTIRVALRLAEDPFEPDRGLGLGEISGRGESALEIGGAVEGHVDVAPAD